MLIGIDWGGTKIEGIALTDEGEEIVRLREKTPRHDYDGCIQIIVNLVNRIEQETGQSSPVGIGIPGSLEPKSRLGKGASSTWLLGRPVERDLRAALGREIRVENDADCLAASESVDGAGAGYRSFSRSSWEAAQAPALPSVAARITDLTTAPVNGDTTHCLSLTSWKSWESLAIAVSGAASRPGFPGARSRLTTPGTRTPI